ADYDPSHAPKSRRRRRWPPGPPPRPVKSQSCVTCITSNRTDPAKLDQAQDNKRRRICQKRTGEAHLSILAPPPSSRNHPTPASTLSGRSVEHGTPADQTVSGTVRSSRRSAAFP